MTASTIRALIDAFRFAAPRCASLQLPGDVAADALLDWATERGIEAETNDHELADGRRWKSVSVKLENGAWICAHREFEATKQSAEVAS